METNTLTVDEEGSLLVLQLAWFLADSKPLREGSVGPIKRDELYERGTTPVE